MKNAATFCTILLASLLANAQPTEMTLDSKQVATELKDHGMRLRMHHNGFNFDTEISFASDGSFIQTNDGSGANSDKGKWEISETDNFLRLTYQVWSAGCFRVVKRAEKLVFFGCRSGKELLVELPHNE
jgi:hypothetical protein